MGCHEGGSEGATSGHESDDALDRRVHRLLRIEPVLGRAGRPVSVTLGPTQTLVYVWKTRHEEAEEGVFVADFSRSNLTYSSPTVEADTPAETLAAQMDELDEEDDLFGGF